MDSNPLATLIPSDMILDMIIGMAMGMAASPLLMRGIKAIRQRRKIDRLFQDIARTRKMRDFDSTASNSDIF
jgi:hypothetical protein